MAKKPSPYPFLLEDRTGCIPSTCPIVALDDSFEAVRIIRKDLWPEVKVVDGTILWAHIADSMEASRKENTIYFKVADQTTTNVQKLVDHLRYMALEFGATPEAIRLIGLLKPWTKKEEARMAEKLKSKASAAKPDKAALKAAAKSTPVGGNKKGKGNADALAKARAAKKDAGPDKRKITVLKKDHGARKDSARAILLDKIFKAKTVQAAIDSGVKSGDVAWASRAGYISLA